MLNTDDPTTNGLIGGIRHLSRIRNRLAHSLAAEVNEEDATIFLSRPWFKAMRDWNAEDAKSRRPSDKPLDALEAFAEFASSMLDSGTTEYSKACQQASGELKLKNGKPRKTYP